MKYGVWLDFPANEPNDGEKVLIRLKNYGQYWEPAVYNKEHGCWDDMDGDDYAYELGDVDKFMLIPKVD